MKLFKVMCVAMLVCAVSTIAYAETQSVKISGDIALRAFARGSYNLDKDAAPVANDGMVTSNYATHLMSTTEMQVDADLTDNVAGCVRLVNQRVWGNGEYESAASETGTIGVPYRDRFTAVAVDPSANNSAFDVLVDLAYIELKEFLYSPLTLKIGRQDIWFGKGFIVGAQQQDPNAALYAKEYTAINSFDAVRATLDYAPWTIDAVYSKIAENGRRADDDVNLWGVNVGYAFDKYNAEAEAYWWYRQQKFSGNAYDAAQVVTVVGGQNSNDIHVLGLRGSFDPLEDWTMALECATQLGNYIGAASQIHEKPRAAIALDAMVECRYWQDNFEWKPVVGMEYIYYSGEKNLDQIDESASDTGHYSGWDPMYRGKFDTAIREFQNVYYGTATTSSPATTNQHQLLVKGCLEPMDNLKIDATYGHFWLAERYSATNSQTNLGDEFDVKLTWDYTEDVSFDLLAGWFVPGSHFDTDQNNVATDIVGSVKLSF
ncbi:MAG: alginate export family protein [Candidatus Omnitrophota bacterium]